MQKIRIRDNPMAFFIMVLLTVLILVLSCNNDPAVKHESSRPPAATPAILDQPVTAPTTGTEGDELNLNGTTILVGRIWASDKPNPILGDRTCAPVVYRNQSDDAVRISPFDWKLTTPQGLTLDATIGGATEMLPFAEIQPRGAAQGSVCFATKHENAGLWTLKYKPSIWSNGELTWTNQ